MEKIIVDFAQNIVMENVILSYLFFFVSQSLQVLFPPYPGDMIIVLEGYLSELAHLNIYLVIVNAVASTSLSSILLFNLGMKKQEKILQSKIVALLFGTSKITKLRKLFDKLGVLVIIFSKFIPGIYSLTVLSAGIFKVRKRAAYLSIVLISSFHHIVLITLGKLLGENWIIILRRMDIYNRYIIIIAVIAFIIYLIMLQLKKRLLD
ncbi:MAG: VTT domain-containing protein [Tissierellales bacterium]